MTLPQQCQVTAVVNVDSAELAMAGLILILYVDGQLGTPAIEHIVE